MRRATRISIVSASPPIATSSRPDMLHTSRNRCCRRCRVSLTLTSGEATDGRAHCLSVNDLHWWGTCSDCERWHRSRSCRRTCRCCRRRRLVLGRRASPACSPPLQNIQLLLSPFLDCGFGAKGADKRGDGSPAGQSTELDRLIDAASGIKTSASASALPTSSNRISKLAPAGRAISRGSESAKAHRCTQKAVHHLQSCSSGGTGAASLAQV